MSRQRRQEMRAALVSGAGERIVAALSGVDLASWVQQVGNGPIAGIENGSEEVRPVAMQCIEVLRQRWWDGDEELADDLESALDPGSSGHRLPALLVDLDEVADLLDSDNGDGGRVDLDTGDTWNRVMLDAFDEFDEHRPDFDDDSNHWLCHRSADEPPTETCRISSRPSTLPKRRTGSSLRSQAVVPSGASKISSADTRTSRMTRTGSPTNAGMVERVPGSPTPATDRGSGCTRLRREPGLGLRALRWA